jgi:amino-acid N-acetyltransferase
MLPAAPGRDGEIVIERAVAQDLPPVKELLARMKLPLDEVDQFVETLIVARRDGFVIGTAGLELYRDGALLRSVAVDGAVQGRGLGAELTRAALRLAQTRGAPAVFLLTTTAESYFAQFGFAPVSQSEVPISVLASVEFRSACPASAAIMRKILE